MPAWPVNPAVVTLDSGRRSSSGCRSPGCPSWSRPAESRRLFGVLGRLGRASGAGAQRPESNFGTIRFRSAWCARRAAQGTVRPRRNALPCSHWLARRSPCCSSPAPTSRHCMPPRSRRDAAELLLRAAIGAGAARLIRQLALEALLVAIAGRVAGIGIARAALATLPGLLPPSIPFLTVPALDLRVAAVALGLPCLPQEY